MSEQRQKSIKELDEMIFDIRFPMFGTEKMDAIEQGRKALEKLDKIQKIIDDIWSPCSLTPTEGLKEIQEVLKDG